MRKLKTSVGCAIILRNDRFPGKFLLTKRAKTKRKYKDHWELPGGAIEDFENQEECIRREIREELSSEIEDLRMVMIDISYYDEKRYVVIVFTGKIAGEGIKLKADEVDDFKYFARTDALPKHLYPRVKEQIARTSTGNDCDRSFQRVVRSHHLFYKKQIGDGSIYSTPQTEPCLRR